MYFQSFIENTLSVVLSVMEMWFVKYERERKHNYAQNIEG